jgi:tetratricopeptide (TPR) repeat protein
MAVLKKSVLFILLVFSINTFAHNHENYSKSYAAETAGRLDEAIAHIKNSYDEKNYYDNIRLGWLYFSKKSNSESRIYYTKACMIMPLSIEAKLGLCYPLNAMESWDELLNTYLEILKIEPANATALYRSALMYYNKGNFSAAEVKIEKYINHFPFDYDGLSLAGYIALKLSKNNNAKAIFSKALLIYPDSKLIHEQLKNIK